MADKLITLSDDAAADKLQRALFAAWQDSEGGTIDRYADGTPAKVQTTTRASAPPPAVYATDADGAIMRDPKTGEPIVLVPEDPKTLVIDARCESFHGAVVHVELAPDVAAQAVYVATDSPKVVDGKVEQAIVLTLPDGKGGTVQVEGKTVDGKPLEKYAIDLSAAVDTGAEVAPMTLATRSAVVGTSAVTGGAAAAQAASALGFGSTTTAVVGVLGALAGAAAALFKTGGDA